jgi:hypothetical protein
MSSRSQEHRIAQLRGGQWIKYSRAEAVLEKMRELYDAPRSHRMRNLLLAGETNNGKTMIVNQFLKRHKAELHLTGESSKVPVLSIQAPPVPDEGRFYNAILTALYAPFRLSARVDQKQQQTINVLAAVGIKMLVIDEIHHVLAGTMQKQRHFLNTLKYLGNELQISLVAVGTRDAFNAVQSDPQLANRFEPIVLPKWQLDDDYLRLLASFEKILDLEEASNLSEGEMPARILGMSEGTIGEIAAVVASAASYVVRNGRKSIDAFALDECDYIAPSARRRQTL